MQLSIVGCSGREKGRAILRRLVPRRVGSCLVVKGADELRATFRERFVDAVVVDIAAGNDGAWEAAAVAREFPSVPFLALTAARSTDLAGVARACGEMEFAEVIVEGGEEAVAADLLASLAFTTRFVAALTPAAEPLGLRTPLQQRVWAAILGRGGRGVQTSALAAEVGLTREHLSRQFSAGGAPNLKRVIDLVRVLGAAELAKDMGHDLPDIARVLGFASPSHLSVACQRVVGVRSLSLARLRSQDLIDRFLASGGSRSRGSVGVAPSRPL